MILSIILFIDFRFIRMNDKVNHQKRTYARLQFTKDEEENIITFVKEHPEIFDPKHENFKNKSHKDKLWNDFGEALEDPKSGLKCFFK